MGTAARRRCTGDDVAELVQAKMMARIDRLESLDAIRQLPARYALALDMRDMDAMVSLFEADVRVGKGRSGRRELRGYLLSC